MQIVIVSLCVCVAQKVMVLGTVIFLRWPLLFCTKNIFTSYHDAQGLVIDITPVYRGAIPRRRCTQKRTYREGESNHTGHYHGVGLLF